MSTHNIQFHDKIRKKYQIFVFLSYRKNFVGTQKRVRISHGKRAIGVRAFVVRLYVALFSVLFVPHLSFFWCDGKVSLLIVAFSGYLHLWFYFTKSRVLLVSPIVQKKKISCSKRR